MANSAISPAEIPIKSATRRVRYSEPNHEASSLGAVAEKASTFSIWCEFTTCHAVLDWYRSESCFGKFFWGLLFLVFFGLANFQVGELLIDFFSHPHYTTTTYVEDKGEAEFPNVTICNFNRANIDRVNSLNMGADQLSYLYAALPNTYDLGLAHEYRINYSLAMDKVLAWEQSWHDWLQRENLENRDVKDWLRNISFACYDMFGYCMWAGGVFDCCGPEHAKEVFNQYGRCWSITPPVEPSHKRPIQHRPGVSQGLKIFVNPRRDKAHYDVVADNFLEEGIVMSVNYDPYQYLVSKPIGTSPGTHMWVAMSPMLSFMKDPDYVQIFPKECADHSQMKIMKGVYDQANCVSDCYQSMVWDACNCTIVSETIESMPSCNSSQFYFCAVLAFAHDAAHNGDLQSCMDGCTTPCAPSLHVDTAVSTTKFPADGFIKHIPQRMAEIGAEIGNEDIIKDQIAVELFFGTTARMVLAKDEKVPLFRLIGNIGGVLGLWLGASMITLIQAFYYLFRGTYKCLGK